MSQPPDSAKRRYEAAQLAAAGAGDGEEKQSVGKIQRGEGAIDAHSSAAETAAQTPAAAAHSSAAAAGHEAAAEVDAFDEYEAAEATGQAVEAEAEADEKTKQQNAILAKLTAANVELFELLHGESYELVLPVAERLYPVRFHFRPAVYAANDAPAAAAAAAGGNPRVDAILDPILGAARPSAVRAEFVQLCHDLLTAEKHASEYFTDDLPYMAIEGRIRSKMWRLLWNGIPKPETTHEGKRIPSEIMKLIGAYLTCAITFSDGPQSAAQAEAAAASSEPRDADYGNQGDNHDEPIVFDS